MKTKVTGHWRTAMSITAEGYRVLDLPWLEIQTFRERAKSNLEEGRGLYDVRMAEASPFPGNSARSKRLQGCQASPCSPCRRVIVFKP